MKANAGAPAPINAGDTLLIEEHDGGGLVEGGIYLFRKGERTVVGRASWVNEWDGAKHITLRILTGTGTPINIVNIEGGQPELWDVVGRVSHTIKPL